MASLISFFVTLKQGHRYFSPLISKHQGRGSVYSGCQFGIQHIEALGVMSEKLELTDQVLRIFSSSPCSFTNQSRNCMVRKSFTVYAAS